MIAPRRRPSRASTRARGACEEDAGVLRTSRGAKRQHSNESDMALDGRNIALIAVACDEIFFGRVATVDQACGFLTSKGEGRNSDGGYATNLHRQRFPHDLRRHAGQRPGF
jgi:hypothetical protein